MENQVKVATQKARNNLKGCREKPKQENQKEKVRKMAPQIDKNMMDRCHKPVFHI